MNEDRFLFAERTHFIQDGKKVEYFLPTYAYEDEWMKHVVKTYNQTFFYSMDSKKYIIYHFEEKDLEKITFFKEFVKSKNYAGKWTNEELRRMMLDFYFNIFTNLDYFFRKNFETILEKEMLEICLKRIQLLFTKDFEAEENPIIFFNEYVWGKPSFIKEKCKEILTIIEFQYQVQWWKRQPDLMKQTFDPKWKKEVAKGVRVGTDRSTPGSYESSEWVYILLFFVLVIFVFFFLAP